MGGPMGDGGGAPRGEHCEWECLLDTVYYHFLRYSKQFKQQ